MKIVALTHSDEHLNWFYNPFITFDLSEILARGYNNVGHPMITILYKRWHEEISGFHLLVWEMAMMLNGVSCLLHIPIKGKVMNYMPKISEDQGVELMNELLGIIHTSKVEECEKHFGTHIGFSWLMEIFEEHLPRKLTWKIHLGGRRIKITIGLGVYRLILI